ncbi:3-dehydroshikimate dehydratase [Colletotrichum tanaceti]|uniref:3-dehydroshikimate dehydratase n=1 Tax=Colletotrichum tanaceti TaxID=1306861 RepID=A0A4U6XEF1_9PEZI|nr:3-dehydroshikimate dehydratase [Colletotrichum tanaceti]TKW53542.1 3-dehydroshikimate dehydratase [Colletotrichum tanaceti]
MSQAPTSPYDNPLSFASCSIGLPRHTLEQKLDAIAAAGFNGIELSFPDLRSFANRHLGRGDVAEDDYASLCEAGKLVRALCDRKKLTIMVLQPFANFEGWPRASREREDAFARARGWVEIMAAVGTDMLQVGSSDAPGIASASLEDLAADLAELADLLAARGFRVAYENWCWATRAPSWRDVWDIVRLADRPNLGLCLDTFQSAGGEFGDPTTASGRIEAAGEAAGELAEEELRSSYESSLRALTETVPSDKIYFLQISDAYKVQPPLGTEADAEGLRPRGRWSHDHRPLPYDGGYLPIVPFLEAVMATGFRGWLSVEVFDGKFEEKYGDDLEGYAVKCREAVVKMLGDMTLDKSRY